MKARYGNGKGKSTGAGAPGVEKEHTPADFCRGTVGMAKNNSGKIRNDRIDIQVIQFMQDIQTVRTMFDDICQRNLFSPKATVIIPTHRYDRSDRFQSLKDVHVPDISCVDN
jgi:hypothetical protein